MQTPVEHVHGTSLHLLKIHVFVCKSLQATLLWPSLSSSTRHTERSEFSKCWTSFSIHPGSTTTRRAAAGEPEGSTSPPAAPPPMPWCGPTSCPAETSIVWVQGCLCGGSDRCTVEEKYFVWHFTVRMTTTRMPCVSTKLCCSDRQRSRRLASAGSLSTMVPLWTFGLCFLQFICSWYWRI